MDASFGTYSFAQYAVDNSTTDETERASRAKNADSIQHEAPETARYLISGDVIQNRRSNYVFIFIRKCSDNGKAILQISFTPC